MIARKPKVRLSTVLRFINVLLLLALVAWLARHYTESYISPKQLSDLVDGYGAFGPVFYVFVYVIIPLFFVPASLITAAAAVLWDWNWAVPLAVLGNNLCANVGFLLARVVGQERVQKLTRGHIRAYERRLEDAGIKTVALLRLFPIMPFTTLSYAAGFSRIRWPHFALGHFIGTFPGTILFILLVEVAVE